MQNQSSQSKTPGVWLSDVVLSLLAMAGGVSIILVVLGITLNVSLIMFRTGSMEPTIPTGAIALVREIPASEIVEGDIVTVDRGEDLLPVTHRVTDITDVDAGSGAVTFVMRGDANDTDDPEPYTATTVQRTTFSIPGMAPFIHSLQNPVVLGGLTLGATALVIWAFWPRRDAPTPRPRGAHAAHGLALPVLLTLSAPFLLPQHHPEEDAHLTIEEVRGEFIRLESAQNHDSMTNMSPGGSVKWRVDVSVDAPHPGVVLFELTAVGALAARPDAMLTEIVTCTPHQTALLQCHPEADSERTVVDTTALVDGDSELKLGSMSSNETRRIVVTATLADPPPEGIQATSAEFQFTATGHDEQLTISPEPVDEAEAADAFPAHLSNTGLHTGWLFILAGVLIIAGIALVALRFCHRSQYTSSRNDHA